MNPDLFERALMQWAEAHRDLLVKEALFARQVVDQTVDRAALERLREALVRQRAEVDQLLGAAMQLMPAGSQQAAG
jgi:hypothetical protein